MIKSALAFAFAASLVALAGCASRAETVGTIGGAAAGHAVGGTVGTVAGGVVGYEAGKYYDEHNKK